MIMELFLTASRSSFANFAVAKHNQGLETLQSIGLCHRDLSLTNVCLRGNHCTIVGLAVALRVPVDAHTGIPHLIEPQPPCASDPLYVAPELLRDKPFDGYAVDLWAAGVMLFVMLLGIDSLFVAPVVEDRKFKKICVDGNLRQVLRRHKKLKSGTATGAGSNSATIISEEAIDLLQGMLRADPKDRLTLADVQRHAWVLAGGTPPAVPIRSAGIPET